MAIRVGCWFVALAGVCRGLPFLSPRAVKQKRAPPITAARELVVDRNSCRAVDAGPPLGVESR